MAFNFDEFKKLRDNMADFSQQFDAWLKGFLLNEGLRFIAEVKPRTPVDNGDLRNAWALDEDTITRDGDVIKVWIKNQMDYASFVEYGHAKPYKSGAGPGSPDWVEGYFMATVSLEVIRRSMPARFSKELDKFIKRLGAS